MIQGQMSNEERDLIYRTCFAAKPDLAVECGTWHGGGSTLAAGRALFALGSGVLHTWDTDASMVRSAEESLKTQTPGVYRHVRFNHGDFIGGLGDTCGSIGYATLDGPEDAEYTVGCLRALAGRMESGAPVILHDWKRHKCEAVKSIILNEGGWHVETELDTFTGIALLRRVDHG